MPDVHVKRAYGPQPSSQQWKGQLALESLSSEPARREKADIAYSYIYMHIRERQHIFNLF